MVVTADRTMRRNRDKIHRQRIFDKDAKSDTAENTASLAECYIQKIEIRHLTHYPIHKSDQIDEIPKGKTWKYVRL